MHWSPFQVWSRHKGLHYQSVLWVEHFKYFQTWLRLRYAQAWTERRFEQLQETRMRYQNRLAYFQTMPGCYSEFCARNLMKASLLQKRKPTSSVLLQNGGKLPQNGWSGLEQRAKDKKQSSPSAKVYAAWNPAKPTSGSQPRMQADFRPVQIVSLNYACSKLSQAVSTVLIFYASLQDSAYLILWKKRSLLLVCLSWDLNVLKMLPTGPFRGGVLDLLEACSRLHEHQLLHAKHLFFSVFLSSTCWLWER